MFNFLRLRDPAVSLLYGKRPMQRITVGGATGSSVTAKQSASHDVEIPLPVVDSLYDHVQPNVLFQQETYQPLQWNAFMQLKLDAYHLMEAAEAGEKASKSALSDLDWYSKIAALYAGQQTLVELDAITKLGKPKFTYPIQAKTI